MVIWVPDALLLLLFVMLAGLMLGLQVVVRKIFRKIISGKSKQLHYDRFFSSSLFGKQPGQGRGFVHS